MSHCHYVLLLSFTSDLLHVALSLRSSLVVNFWFVVIVIIQRWLFIIVSSFTFSLYILTYMYVLYEKEVSRLLRLLQG